MSQPGLTLSHPLEIVADLADTLVRSNTHFDGEADLRKSIVDVQIETQMQGANVLTITISDANFSLLTGGFFELAEEDGVWRLPPVEVEIEGVKWRLVDIQGTTDLTEPNIVLEFQPKAIHALRRFFGPYKAARGPRMTRAEFQKHLAEKVKDTLTFECPELTEAQPVEGEREGAAAKREAREVAKRKAEEQKGSSEGKQHGFGSNTNGLGLLAQQVKVVEEIFESAEENKAGERATQAALLAGRAESNYEPGAVGSEGAKGLLQGTSIKNPSVKNELHYFFQGGEGFQAGGAIKYASEHPQATPAEIAFHVEAPEKIDGLKAAEPQALKIFGAWSGGSGVEGGGSYKQTLPYEFLVTSEEDFWAAMTRLAQEVQWLLWQEQNTLYYMRSFEAIRKFEPIINIDVIAKTIQTRHEVKDGKRTKTTYIKEVGQTVAQFTFGISETEEKTKAESGVSGKPKKRKAQEYRKRTNRNPGAALTTECTLQLICEPGFIHAGDVVILEDPAKRGPWYTNGYEGRWIVVSATRSIFNAYTELTLAIPGSSTLPMPLAEPKNETQTVSGSKGEPGTAGAAPNAEGYVNPLSQAQSLNPERIDQGVDYSMAPGSPILAIGDAEIVGIQSNWYAGQPFVWYKLLGGAYAGKYVYVAEQIETKVKPGDKVSAGQTIATYASSGTGIETGWAVADGETYAKAQGGGYVEGAMTAAGQSFSNWLGSLGCPGGRKEGRTLYGHIGSDYPTDATGTASPTPKASKVKPYTGTEPGENPGESPENTVDN